MKCDVATENKKSTPNLIQLSAAVISAFDYRRQLRRLRIVHKRNRRVHMCCIYRKRDTTAESGNRCLRLLVIHRRRNSIYYDMFMGRNGELYVGQNILYLSN
jgi:hypothetical protein